MPVPLSSRSLRVTVVGAVMRYLPPGKAPKLYAPFVSVVVVNVRLSAVVEKSPSAPAQSSVTVTPSSSFSPPLMKPSKLLVSSHSVPPMVAKPTPSRTTWLFKMAWLVIAAATSGLPAPAPVRSPVAVPAAPPVAPAKLVAATPAMSVYLTSAFALLSGSTVLVVTSLVYVSVTVWLASTLGIVTSKPLPLATTVIPAAVAAGIEA